MLWSYLGKIARAAGSHFLSGLNAIQLILGALFALPISKPTWLESSAIYGYVLAAFGCYLIIRAMIYAPYEVWRDAQVAANSLKQSYSSLQLKMKVFEHTLSARMDVIANMNAIRHGFSLQSQSYVEHLSRVERLLESAQLFDNEEDVRHASQAFCRQFEQWNWTAILMTAAQIRASGDASPDTLKQLHEMSVISESFRILVETVSDWLKASILGDNDARETARAKLVKIEHELAPYTTEYQLSQHPSADKPGMNELKLEMKNRIKISTSGAPDFLYYLIPGKIQL